jgi:hypothetical protein
MELALVVFKFPLAPYFTAVVMMLRLVPDMLLLSSLANIF